MNQQHQILQQQQLQQQQQMQQQQLQQQQLQQQQQQLQQQQLQQSASPTAEEKDEKDKKKPKRRNTKAEKVSKESTVTSPSKDTAYSSQQPSTASTPLTINASNNISGSNPFEQFGFGMLDSEKPSAINTSSSVDTNTGASSVPLSAMFKGDVFSTLSHSSLDTPLEDPAADGLFDFLKRHLLMCIYSKFR